MATKKDKLLGKGKKETGGVIEYALSPQETLELASLVALVQQAQSAQDMLYTKLVQGISDRYEVSGKDISINMEEVLEKGAKFAKLIVKN